MRMTFLEKLAQGTVLFDGSFGTYCSRRLCRRGGSFEHLNESDPLLVTGILQEYLAAGCDAIKTNTFEANKISQNCDDAELARLINAGCRAAKQAAAGTDAFIFADIGPIPLEDDEEELIEQYCRICDLFLANGLTHFLFETNDHARGLPQAAAYIKECCPEAVVIASFAVAPDGFTKAGLSGRELLLELQEDDSFDVIGFNCMSGPYHLLQQVKALPPLKKPLYICPNEGYPTADESARFADNPNYFARLLLQTAEAGAAVIGGCCGTTPKHIKKIRQLLKERQSRPAIPDEKANVKPMALPPIASPLWEKLGRGELVIAAELDPPNVSDSRKFLRNAENLVHAGADTITVADCPVARVRADSSMMAAKLKRELGIDPLPHMTCRDRNLNATRALLLGLSIEDIHNVLLITGDPVPSTDRSGVKGVWSFASPQLAGYVRTLSQEGIVAPFHIWGALNLNVLNFDAELEKAKRKVKNGVQAFLTQPVFTEQSIENLAHARKVLSDVYILGGILPLVSYRAAVYMNNEVAGIQIPEDVVAQYKDADKDRCRQLALEHSLRLAREIRPYVDGYYLITPPARPSIGVDVVRELRKL